ncbi:MAG TPA: DUF3566 domain-containing protein [Ornithinimicrobium sp.]|uniref:DUF3566 domain-containing protein n=1 Tax=Ornithinimicrobium sp. TaxID=1977084 RepID=UPI002B47B8AD|nr:DUF3566 domain-containing protein [Ornithinimicrobium sp.]HKJ12424.1 DUF3566 domain-containing protein [Ornithinimicrobium sp.]
MSTTKRDGPDVESGESAEHGSTATQSSDRSAAQEGPVRAASAEDGEDKPTSASMREGAMARVSPRRDLSSRRQGARSSGVAGGSAAGASAGRAPTRGGSRGAPGQRPRRTGPRRVRLTVQRLDPWSVFKISFLLSVAFGIATVITVAVLWTVLSGMGVFSTLNDFIVQVTSGENTASSFDLMDYIGLGRVVSLSAVFAVANVILLTALATLGAFLYNVCSALVGGIHQTLSDE